MTQTSADNPFGPGNDPDGGSHPGQPSGIGQHPDPGHPSGGAAGAGLATTWAPGYPGYPPYPPRRPTNHLALAALIVGIVSLFSCQAIGAVAIYLGNRARAEIRTSGEEGEGLALAGVIIGWAAIGLAVVTILFLAAYFGLIALLFSTAAVTAT